VGKNILVVDDEQDIARLISVVLADIGELNILFAQDGKEALSAIRNNKVDLVLLDVLLPKLDGYDVCRIIKSDPLINNVKVLMISGIGHDSNLLTARQVGADGYLSKPFNSINLIEKVRELLGK
jgi:CheY-like chemotaxis protein